MVNSVQSKPRTMQEVLQRYPRLTGHLICDSLGYFTPEAAAHAVLAHIRGEPCYCEWYYDWCGKVLARKAVRPTQQEWDAQMLEVGRQAIERAFRGRHHHTGYMAHYPQARDLVDHVRAGGKGPIFASWM